MGRMYMSLVLLACMGALLEARSPLVNLRRVGTDDIAGIKDPNEVPKGPDMTMCNGKFMIGAYSMTCHFPKEYDVISFWDMDGFPLRNDSKYQQFLSVNGDYKSLELKIMNLGSEDIGEYNLNIGTRQGTTNEKFYLTDAEACTMNMLCYEGCQFGGHACPSKPKARCVMNMCHGGLRDMCQPLWYEGLEQVECPDDRKEM